MSEYDNIATTDDVLKLAAQRTGLAETESDSWREGLALILDELNNSPAFTPYGRERVLDEPPTRWGGVCRCTPTSRLTPKVLDAPIERPLIVLGMPRTGTTVISYLLDQVRPADRCCTGSASTRYHRPAPRRCAPTRGEWGCWRNSEDLEMVKQANVALPHWEDADGPTEDMFIHNQDFKGLSWALSCRLRATTNGCSTRPT